MVNFLYDLDEIENAGNTEFGSKLLGPHRTSFPGDRYRRLPPNGAMMITARDPPAGQTSRSR